MAETVETVRKRYCCVQSCEYNKGTREKIRMFRFPKEEKNVEIWTQALGLDAKRKMGGLVCSKHFRDEDLLRLSTSKVQLRLGAIPIAHSIDSIEKGEMEEMCQISDGEMESREQMVSSSPVTHQSLQQCEQCIINESSLINYERRIEVLQCDLKSVQNSLRYYKASNAKLKAENLQMKKDSSINLELIKELEDFKKNELLRVLYKGVNRFEKYSPTIRRFCLALHYHSPRAYEFLRKSFNNNLPTLKTIQTWYSQSDMRGEPGLRDESINRLKKISDHFREKHQSDAICSLVFDEMNLRQQVYWSGHQSKYVGLTENDNDIEEEGSDGKKSVKPVKQAIVFILNGLNINLQYPVAYYLIDSLDSAQRKEIVLTIIEAVTKCNVRINNITFDGLSANVKMCQLLGATLDPESSSFQPFFRNPTNHDKILIILDPCHMEKIIRNTLANKRVIYNGDGEKIEWKYIEKLHELSKESFIATHKITKKHLQWSKNAQSVHLAAQTLSNSTASTMLFLLQQDHPQFISAGATIDFIKTVDTLFDIFNSMFSKSSSENIFKRPLCEGNARVIFDFFENTISYLKSLNIEVEHFSKNKKTNTLVKTIKLTPILQSRNLTAFRGYIINMHSLKIMYMELVQEKKIMKEIPRYYLLQDVIEMFFGKIRSRGGYNNNPNIDQFKGAYRKLLANLEISSSIYSNCRAFENLDLGLPENPFYSDIYFISSKRAIARFDDIKEIYDQQRDEILVEVRKLNELQTDVLFNLTSNFSIAYIASLIEKKIINCPRFYCNDCKSVFEENEKYEAIDLNVLRSRPCRSTYEICKNAERFFKLYDFKRIENLKKHFDFKVVYCLIFRTMNMENLFNKSSFRCDLSHKYQFIKCIVGEYIVMRATQLSKEFTLENYNDIVRHHYSRLIIDKGQ